VPPPSSIGASTSAAGSPSAGSLASSDIGGGDGFSDSPTKVSPEAAVGERQVGAPTPGPGPAGPAGGDGRGRARGPGGDRAPGGAREPLPAAAAAAEAAARLNATLRTPSLLRRAARDRAAAVAEAAPEPAGPGPGPERAPAAPSAASSGTPFAAPVVQAAAGDAAGAGAGTGAAAAAGAAAGDKPVTPATPASAAASPFQSAARLGSFGSGALEADAGTAAPAPAPDPPSPKPKPWCGSCHASVADRASVRRSASLPRALPPVDEAPGCEASAAAHEAQARAPPVRQPTRSQAQLSARGGDGTAAPGSWCGGRGAGARVRQRSDAKTLVRVSGDDGACGAAAQEAGSGRSEHGNSGGGNGSSDSSGGDERLRQLSPVHEATSSIERGSASDAGSNYSLASGPSGHPGGGGGRGAPVDVPQARRSEYLLRCCSMVQGGGCQAGTR